MITPDKCQSQESVTRLWVHECLRIFSDRLINDEDQYWFQSTIIELSNRHLKAQINQEDFFSKPIVFADFLNSDTGKRVFNNKKIIYLIDDYMK